MTLDEAKQVCQDLSYGIVPHKYRYSSGTLRVEGGWVHLGDYGVRAAVVDELRNWMPGVECPVSVRVLVDGNWYYLEDNE